MGSGPLAQSSFYQYRCTAWPATHRQATARPPQEWEALLSVSAELPLWLAQLLKRTRGKPWQLLLPNPASRTTCRASPCQ
jgi:hypothetical protein